MLERIISLTKEFISIPSISENAVALDNILDLALSQLKAYTIERFEHNGVKSALVYAGKTRPTKFKIILNGHLDIIPGKAHQYTPEIKGERLYGVGSMDMKANVACLITVFKELANNVSYPLGLQLTTDEEVGGFNGTKYQVAEGVRAEFVIAGEPTNFDIVHKAKGVLQLKIFSLGKTAHGAYPWKGENAIMKMNTILTALAMRFPSQDEDTWATTVNVSSMQTANNAFNKIPDECVVLIDVRFIPEEMDSIKDSIQQLLPSGVTLEVINHEPAMFANENNKYIQILHRNIQDIAGIDSHIRGAHGTSDARHFSYVRCPCIEFGPIGDGIGSDNEWVDIRSLQLYVYILSDFLKNL